MRLRLGLSLSWLTFLTRSINAEETTAPKSLPSSITLSYELITSPGAKPLAKIDYDPKSLQHTLSSWTPPLDLLDTLKSTSPDQSSPLVRILLPNGSSSVTALTSFSNYLSQDVNIWLNLDGSILSASVLARTPPPISAEEEALRQKEDRLRKRGKPVPPRPKPTKAKAKKGEKVKVEVKEVEAGPVVKVNLLVAGNGPQPKWNTRAPVQVDAEGREIEPEQIVEKTFFQKYWYILLAVGFLVVSGGGGGGS